MSDIKQRTVYLMKRTDRDDDGKDSYVGSTSLSLKLRLSRHRSESKVSTCKLHRKMQESGIYNWKIILLETVPLCEKKEIYILEKNWIVKLKPDLNMNSPIIKNSEKNSESARKHGFKNLEEKRYHCEICDKIFPDNYNLQRHF